MNPKHPLLEVRDLRVAVGERNVLSSVTLDIQAGALVVLMGANGSGKSTLGLALAGHPRYAVTGGSARPWRGAPRSRPRPRARSPPGWRDRRPCRSG